ncbi:MAG TPA: PRC-barrel domain-containing protein [Phycisphaerae bacterium]|jgi:hypothetical protein|nr:PRC-barrel domain-containing protein [Phycisphaerae bacterium]HOJ55724.1 PRC-barrel domain-containing protein [Phycisphaerae bacterium]HOL26113.1 PRC-barrel domain-containing protein [Phycisphaerae bacterium]HPP22029.1 PRC-barrel domain-containing protein [Phycisphaerae bacterium]HPU31457.1 PRC-barrel domain-containing protein [Phycisphaerae bacterium]
MLHRFSELRGCTIGATDGEIGKVVDLYFDDLAWAARYLVVDTGRWLPGKQVLISPAAANEMDVRARVLPVGLSMQQVHDSPEVDTALPVSRQRESELAMYYGWPLYWMPEASGWGPGGQALGGSAASSASGAEVGPAVAEREADPHLRSAREVISYRIQASDGHIGHVEDFIIDDWAWMVRYLVVDTRNFWPGRMVLVPPQSVRNVEWEERSVTVDLPREKIRNAPLYDPQSPIHRSYEEHLHGYYGWKRYWED